METENPNPFSKSERGKVTQHASRSHQTFPSQSMIMQMALRSTSHVFKYTKLCFQIKKNRYFTQKKCKRLLELQLEPPQEERQLIQGPVPVNAKQNRENPCTRI